MLQVRFTSTSKPLVCSLPIRAPSISILTLSAKDLFCSFLRIVYRLNHTVCILYGLFSSTLKIFIRTVHSRYISTVVSIIFITFMTFHYKDTSMFTPFLLVNIQFRAIINNVAMNVFISIFCSTQVHISQSKTAANRDIKVQ